MSLHARQHWMLCQDRPWSPNITGEVGCRCSSNLTRAGVYPRRNRSFWMCHANTCKRIRCCQGAGTSPQGPSTSRHFVAESVVNRVDLLEQIEQSNGGRGVELSFSRISLVKSLIGRCVFNQCLWEREKNVRLLLSFNSQCICNGKWSQDSGDS